MLVSLKVAVSLDGKIATGSGNSKWITGPNARQLVHRLRHEHQAILIGSETLLKDDPSLNTRDIHKGISWLDKGAFCSPVLTSSHFIKFRSA